MTSKKDVTMRLPLSNVIVFTVAENCNAGCEYCYLGDRRKNIRQLLTQQEIEIIFGRYARELRSAGIPGGGIYWHGGDALNVDPAWTHMAVDTVNQVFKMTGLDMKHAMQTNLMRYDESRRDLLLKYFQGAVGSSLDFPNIYRRFGALSGEDYNEHWIKNFQAARNDGLSLSVIALANKATLATDPEDFCDYYFNNVGVPSFQINFPFGGDYALDAHQLGTWLLRLLDVWYERLDFNTVSPFSYLYRRIHWDRGQILYDGNCSLDIDCTRGAIGIGPDGSVQQCDSWAAASPFGDYGNLLTTDSIDSIINHPNRRRMSERWRSLKECLDCQWFRICGGGCPRRAISTDGSIENKDHYCETYRMLFEAVARRQHPAFDCQARVTLNPAPFVPPRDAAGEGDVKCLAV